jgi:hypothetical protein
LLVVVVVEITHQLLVTGGLEVTAQQQELKLVEGEHTEQMEQLLLLLQPVLVGVVVEVLEIQLLVQKV